MKRKKLEPNVVKVRARWRRLAKKAGLSVNPDGTWRANEVPKKNRHLAIAWLEAGGCIASLPENPGVFYFQLCAMWLIELGVSAEHITVEQLFPDTRLRGRRR